MNEGATTMAQDRKIFFSPWLDRATGEEYGPRTAATYAKHHSAHKNWSFRLHRESKVARSADAAELRAWMRLEDGTLRTGLPEGETRAYLLVCELGYSERTAAAKLNCSRRTVRVRLQRLAEKAGQGGG